LQDCSPKDAGSPAQFLGRLFNFLITVIAPILAGLLGKRNAGSQEAGHFTEGIANRLREKLQA
jgi:hypothetical protein